MGDKNSTWETNDMSLAAWLRAKNKRLVKIDRNEVRPKEFVFVFDDTDHDCADKAIEFLNSDAHAFDTAMRMLKKLCFGPSGMRHAVRRSS